jgi:hypothetical protein
MIIDYVTEGTRVYVKIDGCLGGKANRNMEQAQAYADKVSRGLSHFEPMNKTAMRDINRSKNLTRD